MSTYAERGLIGPHLAPMMVWVARALHPLVLEPLVQEVRAADDDHHVSTASYHPCVPNLSLEPILHEVRLRRQAQAKHFDALDTKAGIVLAFAGAIVALSPIGNEVVNLGRFVAVSSGLTALASFWPRAFAEIDLRSLRDLYLMSEPEFTKLLLLDTQVAEVEAMVGVLRRKARRLQAAMILLGIASLLTAVGLTIR
jgi:hypothetical protein